MATLFLVIIYLAFISLGLPDSLLGSAWPVMRLDLGVPVSAAGVISMLITSGTVLSSLLSGKLLRRFGTGKVTLVSVLMTAAALLGFSFSPSFAWFCIIAVPLGLGAGSVDAGLNNFVAVHYKARHMSWLHCCWGIGATTGPLLMSLFIGNPGGWRSGYLTVSIVQFVLVAILLISLPLWKRYEKPGSLQEEKTEKEGRKNIMAIPGVKAALMSFFCYSMIELTTGLWGASYLVQVRGLSAAQAAQWVSFFYLGITIGRLVSGFVSIRVNSKQLIRIGVGFIFIGILLILLPLPSICAMIGFIMIGLGCAPVFPSMLHETPARFGSSVSQSVMGMQMAFSYIGTTVMPPLFGFVAGMVGMSVFPVFLLCALVLITAFIERINYVQKRKK